MLYLLSADLFSKLTFPKKFFQEHCQKFRQFKFSFVCSDRGPNCLQSLSADDKICGKERVEGCLFPCIIGLTRFRLAPVLKTIFHQCVISYTCSQSNSDGSVLASLHSLHTLNSAVPQAKSGTESVSSSLDPDQDRRFIQVCKGYQQMTKVASSMERLVLRLSKSVTAVHVSSH